MSRMFGRSVLTAVLVLVSMAIAPTSWADTSGRDLTVATYNIHHGAGADEVLDLERIARVVKDTGADVVGLQEVDRHWSSRSNFVDQANWLAERLDMHVAYGANLDLEPAQVATPVASTGPRSCPASRSSTPTTRSFPGRSRASSAACWRRTSRCAAPPCAS